MSDLSNPPSIPDELSVEVRVTVFSQLKINHKNQNNIFSDIFYGENHLVEDKPVTQI